MEKQHITEAIQEAVKDYHIWWEKNEKQATFLPYNELRGIIYNKILTRLKGVRGFTEFSMLAHNRAFETLDLDPCFESGMLQDIRIQITRVYCTSDIRKFLMLLRDIFAEDIIYDVLPNDICYKMISIVNKVKAYKL